jgi:hypothetical protein
MGSNRRVNQVSSLLTSDPLQQMELVTNELPPPAQVLPWNLERTTPPSGFLAITGMPQGGRIFVDGTPIDYGDEPSALGYVMGWVGKPEGTDPASGVYVLGGVPVGDHRIEIRSPLGELKTWPAQAIVETTFPNRFDLVTGRSPAGSVVNEINYTTQPGTPLGILRITAMPPGGGISIDALPLEGGERGFALGWVGGNPANGAYVLAGVPVGTHSIQISSSDGTTKTWPAQAIVATVPYDFDLATGRAPAGAVVNELDWSRQPVAARAVTNLPDFTVTLTPTTATATAGEDISQTYQVATATAGDGTVFENLTVSVAGAGLAVAGVQYALDKTTLRSGESATLTLTGPRGAPPGSLSFTVTVSGGPTSAAAAKTVTGTLVVPEAIVEENPDDEGGGISTPVIIGGVALLALGAFVVLRMSRKPKAAARDNPGNKRRRRALAKR